MSGAGSDLAERVDVLVQEFGWTKVWSVLADYLAVGSGRIEDVPTPSPSGVQPAPVCTHPNAYLVNNPMPERRCPSCGAVLVVFATSLDRAIGPETTPQGN